MTLQEMIFHRKSCRSFTGKPVEGPLLETVRSFRPKPLYPNIKIQMEIVSRDKVKCICSWTTPQVIAVYSEEEEGYLERIADTVEEAFEGLEEAIEAALDKMEVTAEVPEIADDEIEVSVEEYLDDDDFVAPAQDEEIVVEVVEIEEPAEEIPTEE